MIALLVSHTTIFNRPYSTAYDGERDSLPGLTNALKLPFDHF